MLVKLNEVLTGRIAVSEKKWMFKNINKCQVSHQCTNQWCHFCSKVARLKTQEKTISTPLQRQEKMRVPVTQNNWRSQFAIPSRQEVLIAHWPGGGQPFPSTGISMHWMRLTHTEGVNLLSSGCRFHCWSHPETPSQPHQTNVWPYI